MNTELTSLMNALKTEAEGQLIPGAVSFAFANGEYNGHRLVAAAEIANSHVGRRDARRTFWRVDGKRVSAANIEKALA